jgi:hypothetical protein
VYLDVPLPSGSRHVPVSVAPETVPMSVPSGRPPGVSAYVPDTVAPLWTSVTGRAGSPQRPLHGPPAQTGVGATRGSVPPLWYVQLKEKPVPNCVTPVPRAVRPSGLRVPVNVPPVPVQTVLP